MQSMFLFHKILILLFGVAISLHAVPPVLNYAGQVAVNGEAFDGNGLFKFSLVNADGTTTYWSNDGTSVDGSEPQASVAVSVNGGLYSILLGNTAQQGMGAIDPAMFAQHNDAKLRVWFSDGVNGFQQLSPDRPFASVPYAFNSESAKSAETAQNAETAKTADSANVATTAMAVQAGVITKQMLNSEVLTEINATIGMNRLSTEVTEKLNQEKTTTNYNAPSVGSLLAVPYGSDAPAGYSLYQRGEPKELVWEEKAPVSVARNAYDGVEVLNGKIYFVGGKDGSNAKNIAERYDPATNAWETLNSLSVARSGLASAVLNGKLYAIGGKGLSSVEVFDPLNGNWSAGVALPSEVNHGTAITVSGRIYLVGGLNASQQKINQVLCFDPSTSQWSTKANMPTARDGVKLAWLENRIWAIAGWESPANSTVESYDPQTDSWRTEKQLPRARHWPVAWVANRRIYVGGGHNGSFLNSIEFYDPVTKQWANAGNFPENKFAADAVVLNDKAYVIAGKRDANNHSNKVFAADLNASVDGIYDLYRKDGDAPVGTPVVQSEYADGSVTTSKLDATILKYLKPEITTQPNASTIYSGGDGSVSFSAEGKYLTYQWKKDGVDLTGETNATLNITDANATLHDGNYSVVVSNDFGSVESGKILVDVNTTWSTDGLVGWWKFDETSGTVAYDSSGNGHDGNLTNGPTWTNGKIGGALSFDGVNDWVNLGSDPFPVIGLPNQAATFSIWFKIQTTTTNQTFFSDYTGLSGGDIHLVANLEVRATTNLGATTRYAGTNYELVSNQSNLMNNSWYAATYVMDPSINLLRLYINGSLDSQNQYIGSQNLRNGSEWKIGALKYNGSTRNFTKGILDDARVYDRALSAEEVQALHNLGQ